MDTLHDDAWIREAGGGFGSSGGSFLPDNKRVWFLSERDGWMHLYTLDVTSTSAKAKQLTTGKWEVTSAELARDGRSSTSRAAKNIGERHLYVPLEGGRADEDHVDDRIEHRGRVAGRVDARPGLFMRASRPGLPHDEQAGAKATQITTTTEEWRGFNWIDPKVITYKARDGVDVYARLFTPEMIGAKRDPSRPAVVFVHGAEYYERAQVLVHLLP